MDLLDTLRAESDLGGEEVNALVLVKRRLDESGLNDLLALGSLDEGGSEAGTGLGHGKGGRTSTVLGLDNLVTTKLDTVDKGIKGLARDGGVAGLGDQGDNGVSGVATNNGDGLLSGVSGLNLRDEAGSSDDIQSGDTKDLLGVVDTLGLEDLGNNGDSRVDGVGDDADLGSRSKLSNALGQITDNGGIGVEQVITGHTGLSGDTSGDDNNLSTGKGLLKTALLGSVSRHLRVGGDVGQIGSNTGSSSQIVEGQTGDILVQLEKQRKGLANTAGSTKNSNLRGLA